MSEYILSCCSTADLSKEYFESRNIHYICFHYMLGDKSYPDDLGQSVPFDEFYARMAAGEMTKTSQVNVDEFAAYFEGFLKEGKDILHVSLSSGLSGSVNSARIAAEELAEKYPENKVLVVDSLKLHHWFFSTDLTFYVRGGRISKAAGWFGTALKICPLLNMDDEGHLIPRQKIRGKKAVIQQIVKEMENHAQGGHDYNGKCFISMSACYDDARAVADLVEEKFPHLNGKVMINNIGTTIGSHTGPGTVALFFWGDERTH